MSYLNLDFKIPKQDRNNCKSTSSFSFKKILLILGVSSSIIAITFIFLLPGLPADSSTKNEHITQTKIPNSSASETIEIPPQPNQIIGKKQHLNPVQKTLETPAITKSITIKQGDTLSSAFNKQGINASVLYSVINDSKEGKSLKSIRKGEKFDFIFSNNKLTQLLYHPDITQTYSFSKNSEGKFTSALITNPLEAIPVYREGIIKSSLFLAASKSNIPVNVIMNMVAIFGWDIDFALDIRKGDSFKLIYNELYQDGEKIKNGKILAAEFTNRGKVYQAILYTDPKGNSYYFSPNGKSMRKAFLRTPVEFTHISSRFTLNRYHPILKRWRSHKGVDYAAPRGTPIKAAGDGKVIKKMVSKSYGNVIFLSHAGKYTTVYAHMNSFARGIRKGTRVKQGQVIGFVGSTGYATGPHLHYEFRVSGVHRNPLTVKLPAAQPINKKYKASFNKTKDKLLKMLDIMGNN